MGPQAAWRHGATSGCKKLEERLTCLDADMQQPTACRKDEGDRVAPKLIANGESHALERSSPARSLRIVQSRGSKARGCGEEGGGLVGGGARQRKNPAAVRERDRGRRMCLPPEMQKCPRDRMEEST